ARAPPATTPPRHPRTSQRRQLCAQAPSPAIATPTASPRAGAPGQAASAPPTGKIPAAAHSVRCPDIPLRSLRGASSVQLAADGVDRLLWRGESSAQIGVQDLVAGAPAGSAVGACVGAYFARGLAG